MMRFALVPAVLAAAACSPLLSTTTAELASRDPIATWQTAKTPTQLHTCLVDAVDDFGVPVLVSRADRSDIVFEAYGQTELLITLWPDGRMEMRRTAALSGNRENVESCV